jgi:hypothetical protein
MNASQLAKTILSQAATIGGGTWQKIEKAADIYVRGYAQTLVEIAKAAAAGDITGAEAKQYARNAKILLVMGITNMTQIVLHQVQSFINGVINTVKAQINAALPFAVL